jgi:hypothetical protein
MSERKEIMSGYYAVANEEDTGVIDIMNRQEEVIATYRKGTKKLMWSTWLHESKKDAIESWCRSNYLL